jgi:hypothetical protein
VKLNRLLDDLDLPRLDGIHDLKNAKFKLCKDEFLRVTQLPDIKPRTGRQLYMHKNLYTNKSRSKRKKNESKKRLRMKPKDNHANYVAYLG